MPKQVRSTVTVRVAQHLPEDYIRVENNASDGYMAEVGGHFDIPSSVIPSHLRAVGTQFDLTLVRPEGSDAVESYIVEECRS